MVVTEITRRLATWTLGGYNPAQPPAYYWMLGSNGSTAPPLVRHVHVQPRIRVRRPATSWRALAGHTKQVTSHNPVRSGCYTLVQGYDAKCSCGWTGPEVYKGRLSATDAVMSHRADAITAQTGRQIPGLAAIEALEAELGDVLPWTWDHGAQAKLRGLTTAEALIRLTPWAQALGGGIEHIGADSGLATSDPYFLWVDNRGTDRAEGRPAVDIRAYPVPDGQ